MSDPKIIKLASGDSLYANQELIKFIKQVISQPSAEIKPDDAIFFFKNVGFKRDLLSISQEQYTRVIKMDKATVVVVNSNMRFPQMGISLKDNKLEKDLPHFEADDVLYNISSFGVEYISVMEQWWNFYKLGHKPRVVFEQNVVEHVNSGIIINESNYDEVINILRNDRSLASRMLDTCNIKESFLFILGLLYFNGNKFMVLDTGLFTSLMNTRHFITSKHCHNTIPKNIFDEMLQVEFLRNRMTASLSHQVNTSIDSSLGEHAKLLEGYNVDIVWKQ